MIVTVEWMERWFETFNSSYFDAQLPLPVMALSRARTRLGQMAFKRASRWGKVRLYDFKISMTTYYDMTDRQAKSVLLHEMIHYAIAYTGLRDTSSHGVVFRGMMDNLNRKYGWDIRVMTSTKGWKVSEQVKAKQTLRGPQTYLMLAIEFEHRSNGQNTLLREFLCRESTGNGSLYLTAFQYQRVRVHLDLIRVWQRLVARCQHHYSSDEAKE